MDFAKVLAQLREELSNLDMAIQALERLNRGGRRRGRPPAWLATDKPAGVSPTRKNPADQRGTLPKKPD